MLGLIFGSFLSVVTYRIPKNISFVKGRSYCPKCKEKISWYDNIPLISFLLLKGKCRECKEKISIRYPLVELLTSISFFLVSLNFYPDISKIIFYLLIFLITWAIVIIDFEKGIIPDELTFLGVLISFLYVLLFISNKTFEHLFSGFAFSIFMLLVHLFTKGKGMGLGDVKFVLFPGIFLSFPMGIIWLFLSFITGSIVGVILIFTGKAKFGKPIAFGPFLGVSFMIVLIWGDKLINILMPYL